ncbi:zinc-finger of a C2HC-type family protein [Leishmania donovani]|uniref:Zinc-finger of a C2HC-type family protein n=1 Tax=Leishmania donovani TaxID=5661 RepID=A0A504XFR5_LEIDO|nr:zinc-finger of a C2HC-type family protein [Leishmania donovani]
MSTTRRPAGPGGLSSNSVVVPRAGGSLNTTPRSATHLASTDTRKADGRDLIVTRGLQQLLENERKHRQAEESMLGPALGGKSKAKGQRRSVGQAPKFIICYLCGRQFGTASIDIHRPQCYLKRLIVWERGDPAIRGPKPLSPKEHGKMMKARTANAEAAGGPATGGGYSCTDRLQVHLKSCRPGKTAKPIPTAASRVAPPVATPSAPTTSASPVSAKDRRIRAASAYKVPANAGAGDVARGADPSPKPSDHTMSSYTLPNEENAEDQMPPTNASSSRNPGRAGSESNTRVLAGNAPNGAAAAPKAPSRDVIELVVEMDVEDTNPPSPRADTEQRLSFVAMTGADPDMLGSSAPNRPALMEPSSTWRDSAAGSQPQGHGTPSTVRAADASGVTEEKQAEDSFGTNVHYNPATEHDLAVRGGLEGGAEGEHNIAKKIRLNNVSHFKNVPSRLNLQRQSTEADLVPCTYCGRKFLPERVQKHEDCCIDRSKPLAARKGGTLPVPPSTGAATPRRAKLTPAAPAVESAATGKAKFCGGCGCKISESDQKFCTECGHKL